MLHDGMIVQYVVVLAEILLESSASATLEVLLSELEAQFLAISFQLL